MKFIIEHLVKIKGRQYKHYFQERIGIMNVMVMNPSEAKIYTDKFTADTEKHKFFHHRPNIKVITYVKDANNNEPGFISVGHDSGIF